MGNKEVKIIAKNKKASHDYHIEETFEAGLVLSGTEIKSVRAGKANLKDSFARISNGEAFIHNMHISPFEHGNRFNHEPTRARKLLLHKQQIDKLIGLTKEKGYSIVPLKLYLKNGFAKLDLALAKGKKLHDKRQTLAKKDAERQIARALKEKQKY